MDLVKKWQDRAEKLGVPISYFTGVAGVDRSWIELLKKRTPKALNAYLLIEEELTRLEKLKINGANITEELQTIES